MSLPTQPVTEKFSKTGGNARLDYGVSAMQRYCEQKKDAHVTLEDLTDDHEGPAAEKHCAKHLHTELCANEELHRNLGTAEENTSSRLSYKGVVLLHHLPGMVVINPEESLRREFAKAESQRLDHLIHIKQKNASRVEREAIKENGYMQRAIQLAKALLRRTSCRRTCLSYKGVLLLDCVPDCVTVTWEDVMRHEFVRAEIRRFQHLADLKEKHYTRAARQAAKEEAHFKHAVELAGVVLRRLREMMIGELINSELPEIFQLNNEKDTVSAMKR